VGQTPVARHLPCVWQIHEQFWFKHLSRSFRLELSTHTAPLGFTAERNSLVLALIRDQSFLCGRIESTARPPAASPVSVPSHSNLPQHLADEVAIQNQRRHRIAFYSKTDGACISHKREKGELVERSKLELNGKGKEIKVIVETPKEAATNMLSIQKRKSSYSKKRCLPE
jgi:hypothetical protein